MFFLSITYIIKPFLASYDIIISLDITHNSDFFIQRKAQCGNAMSKIKIVYDLNLTSMTQFKAANNLTVRSNCTVVLQGDAICKQQNSVRQDLLNGYKLVQKSSLHI
jgi:hypothetical protein